MFFSLFVTAIVLALGPVGLPNLGFVLDESRTFLALNGSLPGFVVAFYVFTMGVIEDKRREAAQGDAGTPTSDLRRALVPNYRQSLKTILLITALYAMGDLALLGATHQVYLQAGAFVQGPAIIVYYSVFRYAYFFSTYSPILTLASVMLVLFLVGREIAGPLLNAGH